MEIILRTLCGCEQRVFIEGRPYKYKATMEVTPDYSPSSTLRRRAIPNEREFEISDEVVLNTPVYLEVPTHPH